MDNNLEVEKLSANVLNLNQWHLLFVELDFLCIKSLQTSKHLTYINAYFRKVNQINEMKSLRTVNET